MFIIQSLSRLGLCLFTSGYVSREFSLMHTLPDDERFSRNIARLLYGKHPVTSLNLLRSIKHFFTGVSGIGENINLLMLFSKKFPATMPHQSLNEQNLFSWLHPIWSVCCSFGNFSASYWNLLVSVQLPYWSVQQHFIFVFFFSGPNYQL